MVLGRLRSEDGEVNEEAQAEYDEIDLAIKLDGKEEPSYMSMLFKSSGTLHMSRRVSCAPLLALAPVSRSER